jgi:TusA-related sulfurtransferase
MSDIKADEVVDLKGLSCPMPMLKTRKALKGAESGKILQVVITDAGSKADMPALLKTSGDELLASEEDNGVFTFFIKKK